MKAILIDDSRTIRMMLKKFLSTQGFDTFFEAGDGQEALTKLGETGAVDLALVDWNMPTMNGLDFVTNLRKLPAFNAVRVVMLTTELETTRAPQALAAGANAYIQKPFTPEVLRAKLDSLGFQRLSA